MLFQNASFFQKFPDPFPVAGLQSLFVLTDMLLERVDLLKKIFLIQKEQIAPDGLPWSYPKSCPR